MRAALALLSCCGLLVGCAALLGLDEDGTADTATGSSSGDPGSSSGVGSSGASSSSGESSSGGGSSGTITPDGGPSPIRADIAPGAHSLVAGDAHSCAITSEKTVKCWGAGAALGLDADSAQPVDIPDVTGVVALAAGSDFTCALRDEGSVWCWGKPGLVVLGEQAGGAPRQIGSLSHVIAVAAGSNHACAITRKSQSQVWCWGVGQFGKLGTGDSSDAPRPVVVTSSALADVQDIAAGADFTCAVDGSYDFWCWGKNDVKQLGSDGSGSQSPRKSSATTQLSAISAGANFACGVGLLGFARCWGANAYGQLGDDARVTSSPQTAPRQNDLALMRNGGRHSCLLIASNRRVLCMGDGADGQTGPGTIGDGFDMIATGSQHTCVAKLPSHIECFGNNERLQLGRVGAGGAEPGRVAGY